MRLAPSRWTTRTAVRLAFAVTAVALSAAGAQALWLDVPSWERLGRSAAGAHAAAPVTLRVAWVDQSGRAIPAGAVGAELQRTLGPAVRVGWRAAGRDRSWSHPEIAVIALDRAPAGAGLHPRAMGAVQPNGRALWVFLSNVAWSLGFPESGEILSLAQRAAVARAAGRIVAHEVTHLVAALGHTPAGLMRARLDRKSLLTQALALDSLAVRALRDCVTRWNEDAPCGTPPPPRVEALVSPDARTRTRTAAP